MDGLETRRAVLTAELQSAASIYRDRVTSLQEALSAEGAGEVVTAARALIEQVVLRPSTHQGGFEVEVLGELAAMVRLGMGVKDVPEGASGTLFESSTKVVAGTGFEPVTFRL